jgi:hypothetical protein
MRLSLFMFLNDRAEGTAPIDGYVAELAAARDEGYATVWTPQLPFEHDLVVTLAVALREVDGIAVGSAVIPSSPASR